MSKHEIFLTDVGEIYDMIACQMVVETGAELERSNDFFDIINLK